MSAAFLKNNSRASLEDLEAHLLSSKRVRDFLKQFSATQWPRVLKATLLLGIQGLEDRSGLSIKDIEDVVVENEGRKAAESIPQKEKKGVAKKQQQVLVTQESYVITSPTVQELANHKNTFKAELQQRRRDIYQQAEQSKRSSSVPVTAPSAAPSQRFNQVPKAAAGWRTPAVSNFQRNGSRPSNRIHYEPILQADKPRSRSLNPLIYPEWWGQDEEEEDQTTYQHDIVEYHNNQQNDYHRHRPAGSEEGWRKRASAAYQESSLDRRLVEAKEAAAQLERMFAENNRGVAYQQPLRHAHFQQEPEEVNVHPQYACRDDQPVGCVKYRSGRPNSQSTSPVNQPRSRQVNQVSYPSHIEADKENMRPPNKQHKGGFLVQHSPPKHTYLQKGTKALTERPSTAALPVRDNSRNNIATTNSNNVSRNTSRPSQPHSSNNSQKQFHFGGASKYNSNIHQRNSSNKGQPVQPAYLKNVESRIKDRVMQDKMKGNLGDKQPEIYVKEKKPQKQNQKQQQQAVPQNVNLKKPQYYENPSQAYFNRGQNIAEIADGFLSSPLMTQFSSEAALQKQNGHGFSNEVHQFIDSPSSHGEKPPTTMTLHLSNVMQGTHNPHYFNHNAGLSSVNTTSHNLCTTTNNTMMMGVVDRGNHHNQNPNYYPHPSEAYNNPMIIQNRPQGMIPHSNENDESGFYSQNDFIMTNSNSNTPNSGGFYTAGTQRRGNQPPAHQQQQIYYGQGGPQYVREQAEDEEDEELSSAYMSKNYGSSSYPMNPQGTTNPFQTRKPNIDGTMNQPFAYNPTLRQTNIAPQTPQLDNMASGFQSSMGSNNLLQHNGQTPFSQNYLNPRQDQVQSPMSEDPNALSHRQKYYYNQHDVRSQNQQYEDERLNHQSRPKIIDNDNDVSTSSYNAPHTEDYRKMFAKTPAGRQEQQHRDPSTSDLTSAQGATDRQALANITPNQAYFNKKTTFVAVKSTHEGNKQDLKQIDSNDLVASPSTHSQGVALKPMIGKSQTSNKSPVPMQQQQQLKSSNIHRVSVSSSNSSSLEDESEESDPNRTGETSNISEGSSYFTNELSQSEGTASRKQSQIMYGAMQPMQGQFSFHNQHHKNSQIGIQQQQMQMY